MDHPDAIEARVLALTAAPLGCAFLQGLGWMGLSAAEAAEPVASFYALISAVGGVMVWRGDYAAAMQRLLEEGPHLRPLARAILAEPAAAWWFAPLARRDQVWVGRRPGAMLRRPVVPDWAPTEWERYGQHPFWSLFTSTGFDGISSYLVGASRCASDLGPLEFPVPRYRLGAAATARVYEVDGTAAWRRLCLTYPAPELGGLKGGLVVPDFAAVARDWDAVHASFGGPLAAEQVQLDGPDGATEFQEGDCEQSVWLRWVFDDVERLPDLSTPPPVPAPFR